MQLQDAADMKKKLEMDIRKLVDEFEQGTSLKVEQMEIYRTRTHGRSRSKFDRVELTIEL